ncbi:MAG: hypothetical protein KA105_07015 [Caulobacter sp.]|jgi:hypothetical protein|nr:hypothetical protein [Caulobacter sp.]
MAVSVANLDDDIRVACRKYIRDVLSKDAVMSKVLGAGGYEMSETDLGQMVAFVLNRLRIDPDYDGHHGRLNVTGGTKLAAKLSGTVNALADYILAEILRRLKDAGVEILP